MPGVAVLPPSPGLGGFGSSSSPSENLPYSSNIRRNQPSLEAAMINGSATNTDNLTVAEIKATAKEHSQRVARGASALTLIRAARLQTQQAQKSEDIGDLKDALSSLTKAASLAQMFMGSADFAIEAQPGKKGMLYREFLDFQHNDGKDLKQRADVLESKLMELERSATISDTSDNADVSATKIGTIADRVRSLQDAGLSVSAHTKRFSRELLNSPVTPLSIDATRNRFSTQISSPPPTSTSLFTPSAPVSTTPSPHATVPLSSFGPPSPTSSDSSSPRLSHLSLSEFTQAFPPIDELDEAAGVSHVTGSSASSHLLSGSDVLHGHPAQPNAVKAFPVIPIDPGPRPSSTPITPLTNYFISRPTSPTKSPVIKSKPSTLGLSSSPLAPKSPSIPTYSPLPEKPSLPVSNTILPMNLYEYMYKPNLKVLLIDVRTREEFQREHIKADAVVCVEPSVLMRETVSARSLEDSLHVAPRDEWVLFANRDKFDLVAIYDESSEIYEANQSLCALVRAIYETAFRKMLKHTPMLLVGGLKAWKRDLGNEEVESHLPKATNNLENSIGSSVSISSPLLSPSPIAPSLPEPPRFWSSQLPVHAMTKQTLSDSNDHFRAPDDISESPHLAQQNQAVNGIVNGPMGSARRQVITWPNSGSIPYPLSAENVSNPAPILPQPMVNGTSSIQYPPFTSRTMLPNTSSFSSSPAPHGFVSLPPQASINPSPMSRRRSEYMDMGLGARTSIDYPDLSSQSILRPPPPAASPAERQDSRPRLIHGQSHSMAIPQSKAGPKPPTIQSDYPVTYWSDMQIITSGLKNLGNTCYMNSTIQCLSATVPFARFFTDARWKSAVNFLNPLGTKGQLASAFAQIMYDMAHSELPHLTPTSFRRSICGHAPQFSGSDQHDSQEFLSFLLDGLHEDLNRVLHKPQQDVTPEREAELEKLPQQIASEQEWNLYRLRNDSLVVDFFQGQFRNRMECLTCHKTSTTYNTFMYLTLPIPNVKGSAKVSLQSCLDAFVKEEVLEKEDAWYCPNCKTLRRATKQLSLSRLPPILLIHLKRFSFKGPFTDKIETVVDFPLRSLDLTDYMPPPLPTSFDSNFMNGTNVSADDPRMQMPPYKYDLYGVTNHFGTLSGGHYTAFVASRGGWVYCDDSRVTPTDAREVVGRPAYVLYYKRVR